MSNIVYFFLMLSNLLVLKLVSGLLHFAILFTIHLEGMLDNCEIILFGIATKLHRVHHVMYYHSNIMISDIYTQILSDNCEIVL